MYIYVIRIDPLVGKTEYISKVFECEANIRIVYDSAHYSLKGNDYKIMDSVANFNVHSKNPVEGAYKNDEIF